MQAAKSTFVNIVDLVDTVATEEPVRRFEAELLIQFDIAAVMRASLRERELEKTFGLQNPQHDILGLYTTIAFVRYIVINSFKIACLQLLYPSSISPPP
ncbi:hypothetical protein FRC12_001366 [Ceratobasidium sp. 428]|nr:hypothetical protein FRC12_001366 [Ceratobasidium sp. 428]